MVHVACHQDIMAAMVSAKWSAWVVMDGGDHLGNIRAADSKCGLGEQALQVQGEAMVEDGAGEMALCSVFLTGDGKAMLAMNAAPGLKCWQCDLA